MRDARDACDGVLGLSPARERSRPLTPNWRLNVTSVTVQLAHPLASSAIVAGVLFPLTSPPRLRLTIERGGTQAVVRIYFDDDIGRRSCLDSRLMSRVAALKLATRVAETGVEVEVVAFVYKMVRPPDYRVRRVKRLDEHRLNRVRGLISCEAMFAHVTDTRPESVDDNKQTGPALHAEGSK